MGGLWHVFVEKLTAAGYSLEDLTGNESLFQLVAEEVCGLTPQQASQLHKEWGLYTARGRETMYGVNLGSTQDTADFLHDMDQSPVSYGLHPAYSTTTVLSRASIFLRHLSEGGTHLMSPATVTEVHVSQKMNQTFGEKLSLLHKPVGAVELMWKLCSSQALTHIREGRRMKHEDACDMLCPAGIVLYRDKGSAARFLNGTPADLVQRGWCLVAFDTSPGNSRRLEEREVQSLQHFTTEECFNSLNSDGYDSIRVVSCNAFVFFHPDQLLPRFIVGIQCSETGGLNDSRMANGVLVTPQAKLTFDCPHSKKGVHHGTRESPPVAPASMWVGNIVKSNKEKGTVCSKSLSTTNCQKHPEKEVEFWCPAEKRLLCSYCLFYDGYTKENCVVVAEAVGHESSMLERWVQNAITFVGEVRGVEELFRSAEEELNRCEAERKDELRAKFYRMHARLDTLEADLVTQVETSSGEQRQNLRSCLSGIQGTVEEIKRLIGDAEGPLARYRAGPIDYNTAVAFLRVAQCAFGDWKPIPIPMYSVVRGWNRDLLNSMEAALNHTMLPDFAKGKVDLPEAIDVNHLKN